MQTLEKNSSKGALSKKLAEVLRKQVSNYSAGERFLSHREIATKANVSQVTARMAIAQLEKEGLVESKPAQGTFILGKPDNRKSTVRNKTVGVILSPWDVGQNFCWNDREVVSTMVGAMSEFSFRLLLLNYKNWLDANNNIDGFINDNSLDSILWTYPGPQEVLAATHLVNRQFPQVMLYRSPQGVGCSAVIEDEKAAVHHMVESMSKEELGSYLLLCPDIALNIHQDRFPEIVYAIQKRNVCFDEKRLLQLPIVNRSIKAWKSITDIEAVIPNPYPDWAVDVIKRQLLKHKPAIVLDLIGYTLPFVTACKQLNLTIGKDIKLYSFHQPSAIEGDVDFSYRYYKFDLSSITKTALSMLDKMTVSFKTDVHKIPFEFVDYQPQINI